MSWSDLHSTSERFAEAAHQAMREGDVDEALKLFSEAANAEAAALAVLSSEKPRTYGITAVSAVALRYKAGELALAEQLAHAVAAQPFVPAFAVDQIRTLLQSIWNEQAQKEAGVSFASGQVLVSVKGGQVIRGGAPLDLILEKATAVQSLFYRTVEYLSDLPLRKKGPPPRELQQNCRPWLFQSVPGSYQFSVALQTPPQGELFGTKYPVPEAVTEKFLTILKAATEEPEAGLQQVVPSEDYRRTFLKMTRNLSPTGKAFTEMEVRSAGDRRPVVLSPSSRKLISETLKPKAVAQPDGQNTKEAVSIVGVLRALDLDKDWLEITIEGRHQRIKGLSDTVDDVIGPMVNHQVIVRALRDKNGVLSFVDIEQEE